MVRKKRVCLHPRVSRLFIAFCASRAANCDRNSRANELSILHVSYVEITNPLKSGLGI